MRRVVLFGCLLIAASAEFAAQGGAVRIGTSGLTPPRLATPGPVPYPAAAQAAGVQGTVTLSVTVDEAGRVRDAAVAQSVPALDAAAVDAARGWQFTPGTLDGKPAAVSLTARVRFALNRNAATLYSAGPDAAASTTWLPPDFAVYYSVQCGASRLLIDWTATPPLFRFSPGPSAAGIPITPTREDREEIFLKLVQAGFFSPSDSTEAWPEPRPGVREREDGLELTVAGTMPDVRPADTAAVPRKTSSSSHQLDVRAYGVWRRATWMEPFPRALPAAIRDIAAVARRIREMAIAQEAVRTLPVEQRYCR